MPRPTAEDRRRDYLDIGAEIVINFNEDESRAATVDALANVKVADVADRAGVTKGAVYHIWPSQEAYRKDLLARLLEHNRQAGIRDMVEILADQALHGGDPSTILERHADFVFDRLKDDPAFFARFSFFVYAADPEVNELLARGDDNLIDDFSPWIERYFEIVGRRIREPFTIALLLTSVTALFQGLCLRYRTSPDLVDGEVDADGERSGPSMYATGLRALLEHFSEPIPDDAS